MTMTDEDRARCERIARGIANYLWVAFSTETLADMVDHEHEPDDDGEPPAHDSLWAAVLSLVYTNVFASWPEHVPFLHDDPKDPHHARGGR